MRTIFILNKAQANRKITIKKEEDNSDTETDKYRNHHGMKTAAYSFLDACFLFRGND